MASDQDAIQRAARQRVAEFCAQLRSAPAGVTGATPVANLEWSVADLAQHVACLPSYWQRLGNDGDHFELPDDFAVFSDQARAHITEAKLDALADLIEVEFGTYLDELAASPSAQRWLYGRPITATDLCGLVISELVMHGQDLATVTGAPSPNFTRDEANAAADAMLVTVPVFIDPAKASKQPDGTYRVSMTGGREYTWVKQGETLTVTQGRPAKADAHLRADPAMFVLSSLGRVSQLRAGLSGKMIAYGKRPWRFLGLASMAVDGV